MLPYQFCYFKLLVIPLGCWGESDSDRAISADYGELDKQKCYDKAKELGYSVFAINIGSKDCYTSPNAWTTYQKYGPISCNDTEHEVNEVYQIRAGN